MNIEKRLYDLQDKTYRDFQASLVPTIDKDRVIGVRVPRLRILAKDLIRQDRAHSFISSLPHYYYDENILHAIIISESKDYNKTIGDLNAFLPYVDNWAVCDTISPKTFKDNRDKLIGEIHSWLGSDHLYTQRFALLMLMKHYLQDSYDKSYLELAAGISPGSYYLDMMVSWFLATALAYQWEDARIYLEDQILDPWIHNKTIQKAIESRRISKDHKDYLKSLKI